jgi:hypothetical protein
MAGDDALGGASRFSDAERGIDERGTGATPMSNLSRPPTIGPLPPGHRYDPRDELELYNEARRLDDEAKEKWKAENLGWPLNAGLRFRSGFTFSEEEIRAGALEMAGYFPGPAGLVATLMSTIPTAEKAMATGDPMEDMPWELVAQIVAQVMVAVAAKKLKASEARALIAKSFEKFGLTRAIAQRASRLVVRVQNAANAQMQSLAKQKGFKSMSASAQGKVWHEAVMTALRTINSEQSRKKTGFWFSFDDSANNQLAIGSGVSHAGPNVDIALNYRRQQLARIELKLSTQAISEGRTQSFMLVHDSLSINVLHLYMTPTRMVLLPDIDGGIPVPIELLF